MFWSLVRPDRILPPITRSAAVPTSLDADESAGIVQLPGNAPQAAPGQSRGLPRGAGDKRKFSNRRNASAAASRKRHPEAARFARWYWDLGVRSFSRRNGSPRDVSAVSYLLLRQTSESARSAQHAAGNLNNRQVWTAAERFVPHIWPRHLFLC